MTDPIRSFDGLPDSGLLWFLNKAALHPIGYALAVARDRDTGKVIGWRLDGDGTTPWSFSPEDDDEQFRLFHELIGRAGHARPGA